MGTLGVSKRARKIIFFRARFLNPDQRVSPIVPIFIISIEVCVLQDSERVFAPINHHPGAQKSPVSKPVGSHFFASGKYNWSPRCYRPTPYPHIGLALAQAACLCFPHFLRSLSPSHFLFSPFPALVSALLPCP